MISALAVDPLAHSLLDKRKEPDLEAENHPVVHSLRTDARRRPRFKIEVEIRITSRTCGVLSGHTVDISETGIAAMLTIEAPLGEVVELNFTTPYGPVTILATVRQRNAFRYGFEFVDPTAVPEVIGRTCHDLAVDQSRRSP